MADINIGKFINNLDKEDLSSEDLQGVVNNVYAKAISDHKKLKKAAEENTKEQDKETTTFVKANHDRLKAHKNKPEKDIDKDDATAKDKVAKEINEGVGEDTKNSHWATVKKFQSGDRRDKDSVLKDLGYDKEDRERLKGSTSKVAKEVNESADDVDRIEWHNLDEMSKEEIYDDLWAASCTGDNDRLRQIFSGSYTKPNAFRYGRFGRKHSLIMGALRNRNFDTVDLLKSFGEKILKSEVDEYKDIMAQRTYEDELTKSALDESNGPYTLNTGKRKPQKGKFNDSTTFEQWYDATFDTPNYKNSEYYPFNNYVKIFSSAESLRNATAKDIVKNAHRFYDVYDVDSEDRNYAFNFARDVTGIDYDDFYNAWLSGEPLTESKKLKESAKSWVLFFDKDGRHRVGSDWSTPMSVKAPLAKQRALNHKIVWPNDAEGFIVLTPDHFSGINYDELQKLYNAGGISTGKLDRSIPFTESKKLRKGRRLKESAVEYVGRDTLTGSSIYKVVDTGKFTANYMGKTYSGNTADEVKDKLASANAEEVKRLRNLPESRKIKESKDKLGKRLTEAEDGNITIETSTSILDLFYPSLYQTIDDYYIPEGEQDRVDDILARTSMDFAEDAIKEVFPSATLKFKELRHPREYNFSGENIIFDVTLPKAEYEKVKQEVAENPEFAQFLKKNSPRSGYIPFGAYTIDKFKTQDDMYSIGQIVKFLADSEDLQYDFDDKFREEISNYFETYDYLWEEVMDWLKEHDQAYQDFLTHFNADENSVIDLDSIIGWISEHDTLTQDFENHFGFSINESLVENYKGTDAIEPGDFHKVAVKELPAEDIDHYESDLYIRKTPKSTELVKRLTTDSLLSTFKSNTDGDIWYELPFCYTPHFNKSKKLKEKYGFVKRYKGCKIIETSDSYVITNEHGKTIGEERTISAAEGFIDEYVSKKEVKESKTPYGDTTIEDYVNYNFSGSKEDKEKLIAKMKEKVDGSDYFNGLNMSVKDWGKAGKEFGLSMRRYAVESKSYRENEKGAFFRVVTRRIPLEESIKRRYEDNRRQAAYENACDCLIYGYGKSYWNSLDLNDEEKKEVWHQAFEDIAEDESLSKRRSRKLKESQSQELEKIFKELNADYGVDVDAKLSEYTNGDYNLWVKTFYTEAGWKKFEKWLNKQGIFDKSTHFAISRLNNWPDGYWTTGTERFNTIQDAKKFADKKFKSADLIKIEDDRNGFSAADGETVKFKGVWMTENNFFRLRDSGKA